MPNPNNSIQGTPKCEKAAVKNAGPETNGTFKERPKRFTNDCSSQMLLAVAIDEIYLK